MIERVYKTRGILLTSPDRMSKMRYHLSYFLKGSDPGWFSFMIGVLVLQGSVLIVSKGLSGVQYPAGIPQSLRILENDGIDVTLQSHPLVVVESILI